MFSKLPQSLITGLILFSLLACSHSGTRQQGTLSTRNGTVQRPQTPPGQTTQTHQAPADTSGSDTHKILSAANLQAQELLRCQSNKVMDGGYRISLSSSGGKFLAKVLTIQAWGGHEKVVFEGEVTVYAGLKNGCTLSVQDTGKRGLLGMSLMEGRPDDLLTHLEGGPILEPLGSIGCEPSSPHLMDLCYEN